MAFYTYSRAPPPTLPPLLTPISSSDEETEQVPSSPQINDGTRKRKQPRQTEANRAKKSKPNPPHSPQKQKTAVQTQKHGKEKNNQEDNGRKENLTSQKTQEDQALKDQQLKDQQLKDQHQKDQQTKHQQRKDQGQKEKQQQEIQQTEKQPKQNESLPTSEDSSENEEHPPNHQTLAEKRKERPDGPHSNTRTEPQQSSVLLNEEHQQNKRQDVGAQQLQLQNLKESEKEIERSQLTETVPTCIILIPEHQRSKETNESTDQNGLNTPKDREKETDAPTGPNIDPTENERRKESRSKQREPPKEKDQQFAAPFFEIENSDRLIEDGQSRQTIEISEKQNQLLDLNEGEKRKEGPPSSLSISKNPQLVVVSQNATPNPGPQKNKEDASAKENQAAQHIEGENRRNCPPTHTEDRGNRSENESPTENQNQGEKEKEGPGSSSPLEHDPILFVHETVRSESTTEEDLTETDEPVLAILPSQSRQAQDQFHNQTRENNLRKEKESSTDSPKMRRTARAISHFEKCLQNKKKKISRAQRLKNSHSAKQSSLAPHLVYHRPTPPRQHTPQFFNDPDSEQTEESGFVFEDLDSNHEQLEIHDPEAEQQLENEDPYSEDLEIHSRTTDFVNLEASEEGLDGEDDAERIFQDHYFNESRDDQSEESQVDEDDLEDLTPTALVASSQRRYIFLLSSGWTEEKKNKEINILFWETDSKE